MSYKGFYDWILEYGEELTGSLRENSCIFGEWIGTGKIKYRNRFNEKFLMFAKANVEMKENNLEIFNLFYSHELFKYPFENEKIPSFIGCVPIVEEIEKYPSKDYLDHLYIRYQSWINTKVEGFIINDNDVVRKYVRFKNGKLTEHVS